MKEKGILVRDIKPNSAVKGIFLVREKNLALTRNGAPYLALSLSDKTGSIEGRIWDKSAESNSLFKKGEYVEIEAQAESFRDQTQLNILRISPCSTDSVNTADFLPSSVFDPEDMWRELKKSSRQISDPYLTRLLQSFFNDDHFVTAFKTAPAAKRMHHAYLAGLLEHTLSVTRIIRGIIPNYSDIDRDLLISGTILHDIGKIREFTYPPSHNYFDYTDEGRLVGHLVTGAQMVREKMQKIPNFPRETALLLEHLILSHHGEYEYGSPKRPKTIEAFALHFADDLDAKINALNCLKMNRADNSAVWSAFFPPLERYLYLGADSEITPEASAEHTLHGLPDGNTSPKKLPASGQNYSLIDMLTSGKK